METAAILSQEKSAIVPITLRANVKLALVKTLISNVGSFSAQSAKIPILELQQKAINAIST